MQMRTRISRDRERQIAIESPNSIFLVEIIQQLQQGKLLHYQQKFCFISTLEENYSPTCNQHLIQIILLCRTMSNNILTSSRKSIGQQSNASSNFSNLNRLVEKFERISSSINIDINKNNLQLFEIDKSSGHFKDDPVTHLRNLQNKSEINRAQIQLLTQRRPKQYSIRNRYTKEDNSRQTYLSIYNRLKNQKIFKEKKDTELTSEDEGMDSNEAVPTGVKHFNQLRQHPRLLQYTLEKLRDKSNEFKVEMKKVESKLQIKSASKPNSLLQNSDFKQIIQNVLSDKRDPLESPVAIVDNQMTKFYSKSSKGKLDVKIKENPRCAKFLERQQRIVTQLEDRAISKQNMKKLKERLNVIVNEINKSDKVQSIQKLPKISLFSIPQDDK